MEPQQKTTAKTLLNFGTILGIVLIGVALIWVGLVRGQHPRWFNVPIIFDTLVGLLAGWLFGWLVWVYGERFPGTFQIRERLIDTFDFAHFRWWQIVALALIAAIPEEIFFRGALQPEIGVVLTSLIFGALHGLTPAYFVYATVAAMGLGLMAEWRGTLWLPIAAHFAVDYVSLMALVRWVRSQEPTLVELPHPLFKADRLD